MIKIDTYYDAANIYLKLIAKIHKCQIEDILISDNYKLSIINIVKKSKHEVLFYKRFFNMDTKNENILEKLYFSALGLKDFIHKEFRLTLLKLMLTLIFSYLNEKGVNISSDFKKQILLKLNLIITLEKTEEFIGKYGLLFLFYGLLENKDEKT